MRLLLRYGHVFVSMRLSRLYYHSLPMQRHDASRNLVRKDSLPQHQGEGQPPCEGIRGMAQPAPKRHKARLVSLTPM